MEEGADVNAKDLLGMPVLGLCLGILGPSGFDISDLLVKHGADVNARDRHGCQMAKFDPFLSLDWAPTPSTLAQSKERKGSNFVA